MTPARTLVAEASDHAGIRTARVVRSTGTAVALYSNAEAGIDNDPTNPWVTFCLTHDRFATHPTRRLAEGHLSDPVGWCEVCSGSEAPDDEDGLR